MYKRAISLLLSIAMIFTMGLCLCSCNKVQSNGYPVTINDVTIEKEPQNIVVLSDCMADIISYMGYDVKMVGRSIECDQPFLSVVPIVGTASEPNVESIISNETNLVIAENTLSEGAKTALAEANIPVLILDRATSLSQLEFLYSSLGLALGGSVTGKETGENSYDELFSTMSDFNDAIPNSVVKTCCYLYMDEAGTLCTLTKGTIEYDLFSYCSAINVFSEQEEPQVDINQLKISTPSFIFYDDEAVLDYLNSDPELSTMGALTQGKTYQVKKSYFTRQGTTCEELIYHMIDFMFSEETDDEVITDANIEETIAGFAY